MNSGSRSVPTSLEILQSILEEQSRQEAGSYYTNPNDESCFVPNKNATHRLAKMTNKINISKPILNVGMPKCGSTTLYEYFLCAGWNVSHSQTGLEMMKLVNQGNPSALRLSDAPILDAYAQMDYNRKPPCAYPQIQFLDEIHMEYPDATFVLLFRPVEDWIDSVYS